LFTFNVGVEVGQLLFVVAVLLLFTMARRFRFTPPIWGRHLPGYVIGGIAAYWTIERFVGFWA